MKSSFLPGDCVAEREVAIDLSKGQLPTIACAGAGAGLMREDTRSQ